MSAGFDPTFGWHEIADHTLVLRGLDGVASLKLDTDHVLGRPDSIHTPSAIAFDAEITLPRVNRGDTIVFQHAFGCYGAITGFAYELTEVRHGRQTTAELHGAEGFQLTIIDSPKAGLCVYGSITNPLYATFSPFPEVSQIPTALDPVDQTAVHDIRFAFLSSLVEPPLLDNFISDINQLTSHLALYA